MRNVFDVHTSRPTIPSKRRYVRELKSRNVAGEVIESFARFALDESTDTKMQRVAG